MIGFLTCQVWGSVAPLQFITGLCFFLISFDVLHTKVYVVDQAEESFRIDLMMHGRSTLGHWIDCVILGHSGFCEESLELSKQLALLTSIQIGVLQWRGCVGTKAMMETTETERAANHTYNSGQQGCKNCIAHYETFWRERDENFLHTVHCGSSRRGANMLNDLRVHGLPPSKSDLCWHNLMMVIWAQLLNTEAISITKGSRYPSTESNTGVVRHYPKLLLKRKLKL